MILYSQHDPSYDRKTLGVSKLTVHGYGCFLVSMANLFQKSPIELLSVSNGITPDGLLNASVMAKYCGGEYLGQKTTGQGWQIAQTDHYAAQGFSTHFFCVNLQERKQIDPLNFPAKVEPLSYRIVNIRIFTDVALPPGNFETPLQGPFPDVKPNAWSADAITFCKNNGFMKGYETGLFNPKGSITREEIAVIVQRLYNSMNKV